MAEWTSAVGAPQLARLLASQRATGPVGGRTGAGARRVPAYRALADGVRLLVLEGRIPVAARLPAERELAAALSVSRTTVAAAYEALRADGFLASRRGAGSWTALPAGNPLPSGGLSPLPPEAAGSLIDLGCAALPAPEPWLTRAFQAALADLPPYAHTHGDYPAGLPVLRRAVADRYTARGVPTMPEQIMITTGAMGAVAAIRALFAPRGERVAVEHPSYANVLQLLREAGARLVPVAMGEGLSGWDLPAWRRVLRDAAPRMAYVMADYHNPTGVLADDGQRRELVAAARAAGTVLVADETMSGLDLDPAPGEEAPDRPASRPVAAFDPGGSTVVTLGSVSKAIWAGLRIGWIRAAPETIRSLVAARVSADLGSPVLEQLAVAWLLSGGEGGVGDGGERLSGWDRAVAVRRERAGENRDALVAALRLHLPDWEFDVPRGGLTLWVRTGGLSGSRIAEVGERLGVRVPAGTRFGVDGAFEGYVRLPFTVSGPVAGEAAARLAAAARLVAGGRDTGEDTPRSFVA
ncbi:aminotransferase class I/II-fold pyridoxal phosphate-dependent enzyme [Streptomyces sp. TRM43335]|uniref:Aminotransferase class I/II-fold pyridoxal phosphate-dependent enzyme n=1 Tax=Streptomyces taklimakanensis TaxID=2569853 RepID=A0A6G2B7F0_9ACTN|nr:PLP-dependent aminotransferase family protein [Streptomyces taklimakanensis]MTE18056.1 aminotransferase class I/II-fold pyridoxal phosphate-dependent enzyme [Streptomyces taklimakanensis]